ncbi:MAG: DMT family transporter [Undibacterium sp.]|uniref:DMT family transporter n=1 Tax=Undibacterium sp. TaxID=1914977 RepID=UPI00271D6152|nr:DMT family transporter [Undibacterium sp.]MDO8650812.1 DMT family transporter [Undibacterium sp.]
MHSKAPVSTYLKLICVALFWGGTFIAGRIVAKEIPHLIAAAGRFLVACSLLLLLAWRMEGGLPKLNRQQIHATFGLGATGIFLYNICFFAALERMPAGRSALFVALNPIVTALALAMLFGEKLGLKKWLGIAIAFVGAAIVITRGDLLSAAHDISNSVGSGELFMLTAVCAWAAYTILGRHALKGLSPIAATTYASLWGLLLLGIGALFQLPQLDRSHLTWPVLAAIFYLGAFGTVIGFVWYYEGVKRIGPTRTAVFNNLVPVFGISFGALLLGEPILASMVIGGLLVIAGVSLTNR